MWLSPRKDVGMLRLIRNLTVPLVAVFALCLVAEAKAVTVTYYTVGQFSAGTSGASVANGLTGPLVDPSLGGSSSATKGGTTLRFDYSKPYTLDETNSLINTQAVTGYFGNFNVTSSGGTQSFTGLVFTLYIYQQSPTVGDSSLAATVQGSFTSAGSNGAYLQFTPSAVTYIPSAAAGVKYDLEPFAGNAFFMPDVPPVGTQDSALLGLVSVPLPGVAVGGLWLLGGLGSVGGLNALRRRLGFAVAA